MSDVLAVLAKYPPDCRFTDIEPLGFAGGMSGAQFWRVAARRDVLVLRRWPIEHPTPDRLTFIHAVLRHAAARGCDFLPVPITTPAGESFITSANHLWELAPWMPGAANYNQSPRLEKLQATMRALAQFHAAVEDFAAHPTAPGSAGGSNAVQRHLVRLQQLTPERVDELSRAIRP
ncbi:MAG TPA: phosphotransferase, partial [Lacipirellulaceae bacterium]|nr:phosphotransferase [Lacipirellulaceae bacterium]